MNDETTSAAARELTFGEKAVGLSFNPSNNAEVDQIKREFAKIIDTLHLRRSSADTIPDQARMLSIAITEAQTAQMWAVKAVTWRG
jgi:hypothetical protein